MQPGKRWLNLRDCHELYCAGHLIEAAVAYFEATGKRKFLDVMCRYADHIIGQFGPEPGKRNGYCGHEEIELALVKLARVTGERRYLEQARYFIDERGQKPRYFELEAQERGEPPEAFAHRTPDYNQSHIPVREQKKVVGHAVRAMYLFRHGRSGDRVRRRRVAKHAGDFVGRPGQTKRLYVTGGLGPSQDNEGFTRDYDLPNESAYAETCAAVGRCSGPAGCSACRRMRAMPTSWSRRFTTELLSAPRWTARAFSTRTRWRAWAITTAGSGTAAHAARLTSRALSPP